MALRSDVSDPAAVEEMVDKVEAELGSLDILISNAEGADSLIVNPRLIACGNREYSTGSTKPWGTSVLKMVFAGARLCRVATVDEHSLRVFGRDVVEYLAIKLDHRERLNGLVPAS